MKDEDLKSHCEDLTVCIIGENNGRTSAKSVLARFWGGGDERKGFSRMFCFAANMVEPHLKDLSQRFQMHRDIKSLVECADDVSEHRPANDALTYSNPKNCPKCLNNHL